jgi:hypothetical protein
MDFYLKNKELLLSTLILSMITSFPLNVNGIRVSDKLQNNGVYKNIKKDIIILAKRNGINPNINTVNVILKASKLFQINPLDLTAIAIVETRMGTSRMINHNTNGSIDIGLFQINTVNHEFCIEYNLKNIEGSAYCAAKILSKGSFNRERRLMAFHSKTPDKGRIYLKKINAVFKKNILKKKE